ncbi:hypothetical protein ACLB2K_077321 [Fragaria x ananassa]
MGSSNPEGSELPNPPPIPPNVVPIVAGEKPLELINKPAPPKLVPMKRPGIGSQGQRISLLTNHFKVGLNKSNTEFYHYSIAMQYDDGTEVDGKGIGRKVLDKVKETYRVELENKEFAYDGEKSLFTVGQLPSKKLEFTVVLNDISSSMYLSGTNGGSGGSYSPKESQGDRRRVKQSFQSKTIQVQVNFAAKIPMQAIANALRGQNSDHFQEEVRVLDIIIRQNAAKQGCLLVRQSFFHNNPRNFIELGGGVLGCRGFHSSFRATQSGLSLNMHVSTIMIVKPGPVLNFLMDNQNVKTPYQIDWIKAKRMLKNPKVETYASKMEYKITGLSDKPCKQQTFFLKSKRGQDGDGEEITVYEYFAQHKNMSFVIWFPCNAIPRLYPISKGFTSEEVSAEAPRANALKSSKYEADMMLHSSGISIGTEFMQVEGRVLPAPRLDGINSLLMVEHSPSLPLVSKSPTLILGMDVSHGSPGRSDVPSIAAVVSSRKWPLISCYRAAVRTQSPKVEMIANLFKPVSDKEDQGIIRDGVSESQFNQVLNVELDQIIEACKFLDESWCPRFMVIIAQKNHHTKFFQASGSPDNVPPGYNSSYSLSCSL